MRNEILCKISGHNEPEIGQRMPFAMVSIFYEIAQVGSFDNAELYYLAQPLEQPAPAFCDRDFVNLRVSFSLEKGHAIRNVSCYRSQAIFDTSRLRRKGEIWFDGNSRGKTPGTGAVEGFFLRR